MFELNIFLFFKILTYFCTGILLSCLILYFYIPVLRREDYSFLFSVVFLWPIIVPCYMLLAIPAYFFERVEEWRYKRIVRDKDR